MPREGVRLELLHRRHSSALRPNRLLSHGWKLGLAVLILAVVASSRSAAPPLLHPSHRTLAAANAVPTAVQCGALPVDSTQTAVWNANGSPYILPWNDPKIPATDSTRQPNCLTTDAKGNIIGDEVHLSPGTKLVIDGSLGPVQIFSHGAGISIDGGEIRTVGTDKNNFVSFDAEPDVASWDGIAIHKADPSHVGDGSFSYVTIQHALTALSIDSGATSSPDDVNYGLTVANSGIGPSYFDGIDGKNTPIAVTGLGDGQYGTVNNIGSQGINVSFDNPPAIGDRPLKVTRITFGSSVPFGETGCPPEPQPCANRVVGSIGNNALIASLPANMTQHVLIDQNNFFRAGSFGVELVNADHPQITNNDFVCNGSGSPSPVTSCVANGTLQKFSAIYLENVSADLYQDPAPQPSPVCPPPGTLPGPPPAFPGASLANAGVSNNVGQENGLDALVLSGRITHGLIWQRPFNDPNSPSACSPPHDLGFMVGNVAGTGGIELVRSNLTVNDGDVVKVQGGGITLTGGKLDASTSGLKTFTSMRDNGVGIQACPSVFVQSCLATLPSNEWSGINLSGATAIINNANILFPTKGVSATGAPSTVLAPPDGQSYGLVLTGSRVGPTFSDSVATSGEAIFVSGNTFCRIDPVAANPTYGTCTGAGPGDHGINFAGTSSSRILKNNIQGSANEGILGTGLGSAVDIEGNTIDKAGAYGLHLAGANNPTITGNVITRSGTSTTTPPAPPSTTYSAMLLTGLSNANFETFSLPVPASPSCTTAPCISWNTGYGNGLDAIAFDGSIGTATNHRDLNWMSPANVTASAPLGYIIDDNLQVNGALTLKAQDLVEVVRGEISVTGGKLSASGALITSIKQGANNLPAGFGVVKLPTCGSSLDPLTSGKCQAPGPGDWTGLVLDGQQANTLSGSTIRFAGTGIEIDKPADHVLSLAQTNIQEVAASGIHSESSLVVNGGQISNTVQSAGNGIWFDAGATISGTQISNTGQEGILGTGLNTAPNTGAPVVISGTAINGAGTSGIRLASAGPTLDGSQLTVTDNVITNSGKTAPTYPAIDLNDVANGVFLAPTDGAITTPSIRGNTGSGNGIDAVAFYGSAARDMTWVTAYKNRPAQPLGYLLIGDLDMNGHQLTVKAGAVVKVGNGGAIKLDGGQLLADDTSNSSSQKIFTSLSDSSAGVNACPSIFLTAGCGVGSGYWGGIVLHGAGASGSLANAVIRYATTGINIDSGATGISGSTPYGLVVSRSTIGPTQFDGIDTMQTAISVTNSTLTGNSHGISADLTGAPGTALRISGNRFVSTSAEAILGQALAGQPVWITDNQVQQAGTFAIRLVNPDHLVLRNNNISASGKAAGGPYSAIYLNGFTGDFARDIRGNVGSNNALDAIAMHGTVQMDSTVTRVMQWINPVNGPATHPLGYLLDGSLTLENSDLTVSAGSVVKVLSGAITINQGVLNTGAASVFTSFRDTAGDAGPSVCPSVFITPCAAASARPGDWGGVSINGVNPTESESHVTNTTIRYTDTAISIDAGPFGIGDTAAPGNFRLEVVGSTISDARGDGINSLDTPIKVDTTTIGRPAGAPVNIGGRGIIAVFLGAANCATGPPTPPPCERLHLTGNTISWTGKDGIVANGLTGQPTKVAGNDVEHAGAYGIRLLNADTLTLDDNTVNASGGPNRVLRYPAVYLPGVKADFDLISGSGTVTGNHGSGNGLDAVALDGEATKQMTWQTTGTTAAGNNFGYLLDGGLTVDGDLTTKAGDNVKVLNGAIKINGALNNTGATFTSLKDGAVAPKLCDNSTPATAFDSVFLARDSSGNCPSAAPGDWGGINIDASPSSFNGGTIKYVADALTINSSSLSVTNTSITNLSGYAVKVVGTGYATIDCSAFHANGGGLYSGGAANQTTFSNGDLYDNPHNNGGQGTNDLNAVVDTTANNDWWGAAPPGVPPSTQLPGPGKVTAMNPLRSQAPVLTAPDGSITVTGDNSNTGSPNRFGKGLLHVVLKFSRKMNTTSAPTVYFTADLANPAPQYQLVADTTPGLQNGWDAAGIHWYGHFSLDPAVVLTNGAATVEHLVVKNASSCVPEPATNQLATDSSATFTVDFTGPTFGVPTAGSASQIGSTSMTLNESINPNGWSASSDSTAYFEITSTQGSYETNPMNSTHIGTQSIGSGGTVPVFASTIQIQAFDLTPSTNYWYRAVVTDLNGTFIGPERGPFTTTAASPVGALDHFEIGTVSSPQASQFPVQIWAFDANNNVKTDYSGPGATLGGNLHNASPCTPTYGSIAWGDGTAGKPLGKGTATVTACATETQRQLNVTDGAITKYNSNLFTVGSTLPPTALSFSQNPSPIVTKAGAVSTVITLQTVDQYGNVVPVANTPLQLVLSSDNGLSSSGGSGAFFQADGFTPLASPTIPVSASSLSFTYRDTVANNPTLTASAVASPVTAATQKLSIGPGDLNHFTFTPIGTQTAGVPFNVTVKAYDAFGNLKVDYPGPVSVTGNLSTAPTGDCSGATTPCPPAYPNMPAQQDWSTVKGVGTLKNVTAYVAAGNRSITVTDSTVTPTHVTSASFAVTPASTSKLVFTTPARSTKVGVASAVITVQEQDAYSNPVNATADVALTLSSTTLGLGSFFGPDGTTPLASAKISAGTSSLSFTYSDTAVGTPTVRAHSASIANDGMQAVTITAT